MKFCNRCGNSLLDNIKFCDKCGIKIEQENIQEDKIYNNYELESEEIDDSEDCETDTDFQDEISSTDEHSKKKYNKKYAVLYFIIALILIFISSAIYFSKDSILKNYYYNKGNKEVAVSSKLIAFNNSLKYDYNEETIQKVFEIIKSDSYFLEELDKVNNLEEADKKNLIQKILILKSDDAYNKGAYTEYFDYLKIGKEQGIDIKNYLTDEELSNKMKKEKSNQDIEKIEDIYTFENENPIELGNDIYKYPYDYIASSSNRNYLTESYLSKYNKETLALIRNEIFARHGYAFKEEPFKTYFNSKAWYKSDYSFKGDISELNEYEIKNVNLIKELEENR